MSIDEKLTLSEKLDRFFNTLFAKWGLTVARNPCKIFWISLLVLLMFASGMGSPKKFPDEEIVWTPAGNPSILARDRSRVMFPSSGGFIGALFEVKGSTSNIITLNAFKEMEKF